jgi:dCTP deaminase
MSSDVLIREPEFWRQLSHTTGILPSQEIERYVRDGYIAGRSPIEPNQIQPSSLDLRLGPVAYQVCASFLANDHEVLRKLEAFKVRDVDLRAGALLERGGVYIVPLEEELNLPRRVSGKANPKSSTGRLDIFTRLIVDYGRHFEQVPPGYRGRLYAEIVPRTFPVIVRQGTRLNQLRLVIGQPPASESGLKRLDQLFGLVYSPDETPAEANISKESLYLSVDLCGTNGSQVIGYKARTDAPPIDLALVNHYDTPDYWEPILATPGKRIILDRDAFYILASKEKVRIPPEFAAEMVPFDPSVGEFRIHYAGFFDPGFGYGQDDIKGTHAVLEVRSHEVPFVMEDGQGVGRLIYERLLAPPAILYGSGIGSSYQRQGLKLSKHFRET